MVEALLDTYRAKGWTIATAESCTGGMLSAALTDIPGSSDVFDRGFVTYSNAAKTKMLSVPTQLIEEHGAVSRQVAEAMAIGARKNSGTDVAISITGVAGPGGTDAKPEGMVCFGIATKRGTRSEIQRFGAIGRTEVRKASVSHALELLLNCIEI